MKPGSELAVASHPAGRNTTHGSPRAKTHQRGHHRRRALAALAIAFEVAACGESGEPSGTDPAEPSTAEPSTAEPSTAEPSTAEPSTAEPTEQRDGVGPMPAAWVTERLNAARERLNENEAGNLLWQSIEAHGGLEAWLSAGTIEFEFDYAPLDDPEKRRHTFQRLDLWNAHAHHAQVGGDVEMGWDGETAWIKPNAEAFPSTSRFWSLTPYYFVGMPFVLADPGVILTKLEDAELDGEAHDVVKATYESGTGDSPDDYYILYLDKESHTLAALRYVVSYPGFFPNGGHTPEKLMRYTEPSETDGLTLATRYDTFAWNAEEATLGDKVTEIRVTQLRLGERYDETIFAMPDGAIAEASPTATE